MNCYNLGAVWNMTEDIAEGTELECPVLCSKEFTTLAWGFHMHCWKGATSFSLSLSHSCPLDPFSLFGYFFFLSPSFLSRFLLYILFHFHLKNNWRFILHSFHLDSVYICVCTRLVSETRIKALRLYSPVWVLTQEHQEADSQHTGKAPEGLSAGAVSLGELGQSMGCWVAGVLTNHGHGHLLLK